MLFNSLDFAVFLPIVFVLYWFVTNRNLNLQNALIVAASYVFYGWWDWRFLSLIVFSTIVDFGIGLRLNREENSAKRKALLWTSIIVNLGFLGFFKYYNFFLDNFVAAFSLFGHEINAHSLNIILPVGISFYTFQTLSYTIDVYKKELEPTEDFVAFSAFVCFFPQLVAGPIERASNLLSQITAKRDLTLNMFKDGLLQISVGFFRKIVVADTLGVYVDHVFNTPESFGSSTLTFTIILYSFQIYYDFAGYSDIAIGVAKLFGFEFKQNFNVPYFSKSVTEFWRRWHMSLSSWLRDYLYIPLGGNRNGKLLQYRNLLLTMLLGGLWHGSSWVFVIWGLIHGLLLSIEKLFEIPSVHSRPTVHSRLLSLLGQVYTYAFVCFAWIFFRSTDLEQSINILENIIFEHSISFHSADRSIFMNILLLLPLAIIFDRILYVKNIHLETLGSKLSQWQLIGLVCFFIQLCFLFYSKSENFIYFQF